MVELRILWHSVAPFVNSGYGTVTKNIPLRLAETYPLIISTYYGLHPGASLRIGGVRILPTIESNNGEYSVKHFIEKFKINLPILSTDFWPFKWFSQLSNAMCYGPIDSFDYSFEEKETMKNFPFFIPCSEFGALVYSSLTKKRPLTVIPHGVDTQIFSPQSKQKCRRLFNLSSKKFIFGIVAANSDPEPRKGWDDMLLALANFREKFPSERNKWIVFAFTKPNDSRGYNLSKIVQKLHLENHVIFPEHLPQIVGLPDLEMAKLYSSFDVLLNASRREGFCIPVLEAQACGIPVIASNSSALPELIKDHGWLVQMGEKVFTPSGWTCQKADREDLLKKIEDAYFNKEKRLAFARDSFTFAKTFDWRNLIQEKWLPLLRAIENEQPPKVLPPQV